MRRLPKRRAAGKSAAVRAKGVTFTPRQNAWQFSLPGSRFPGSNIDYGAEVKNGMHSSVVTSALAWIMRTFPEAPIVVQRRVDDRYENVAQHDLTDLIRTPNPQYSGRTLLMATAMEFCFGEAFWLKVRNGEGTVVELWWVPRALITPMPDPETPGLLKYYRYAADSIGQKDLEPDDVVHFRFGMDPNNLLRGFSPLAAVMREVYTDDQAANFTAAILRNLGIVGVIFSPKEGIIAKDEASKLKEYVQSNFTGDKRAQAMMFTGAIDAKLLQYNLQGFDVGPIRDISEERVCAALAIPAAVIGFGTGLSQVKVGATMREMVKLAWQGGLEPNQSIIAAELDRSLLPEFQKKTRLFRTHFDTSQVEALTESPTEKTDRVLKLVDKNVIKITQAQRELGYPVDSTQDKYMRELMAPAIAPTPVAPPVADPTPKQVVA